MNKDEYLNRFGFPKEWIEMFPDALWEIHKNGYKREHEESPEHDRNGAFHWWLRHSPSKEDLRKLAELSFLDPDQIMAADVRRYIRESPNCDAELVRMLDSREVSMGGAG